MINFRYMRSFVIAIIAFLLAFGTVSGQDMVFNVGCMDGQLGDTICVDVTVENFTNVEYIEGSISFNSTMLEFVNVDLSNSCVSTLEESDITDFFAMQGFGFLNIVYFNDPISCPNGANLMTLCFEITGDPGDCTNITFDDTGIDFNVGNDQGDQVPIVNTCPSCVLPDGLTIVYDYCEASPAGDDASLKFYATGGAEPYAYTVERVGSGIFASGNLNDVEEWEQDLLPSGTYIISVTDANGQMESVSINITDNFPIEYDLTGTNPTCWNRENGVAEITMPTGGQRPYVIEWSNKQFNKEEIDDLEVGNYSVTVTDATGCALTKDIDLTVDTVKVEVEILENLYCEGADNARVLVRGLGGISLPGNNYTFLIIDGPRIPNVQDFLLPGTALDRINSIVAIDNSVPKCTSEVVTFEIPVDNEMTINSDVLENVRCKGAMDGMIEFTAEIGTETNFSFRHEEMPSGANYGGGTAGPNIYFHNNVGPGMYRLAVRSSFYGCVDTLFFEITEPAEALTIDSMVTGPTCVGNDGMIVVDPMGGDNNYTFDWGISGEDTNTLSNLNGGDFKVVVTDGNGCKDSLEFSLQMGGNLSLTTDIQKAISCPGDTDGEVFVNVTPTDNYTYEWTDASGMVLGDMDVLQGVGPGWYYVTVDGSGCTAIDSVFLPEATGLFISQVIFTEPECPGQTGLIGAVPDGGIPGYDFIWTQKDSTLVLGASSVLTGVMPGEYNLSIMDQAGCMVDTCLTLKAPAKIDVDVFGLVGVGCSGDDSGEATATASGGSTGATSFTFLWSSGETGDMATGLSAGLGWVIASDTKCSSDTSYFTIPDAAPVGALVIFEPPTCAENCDASINVMPNGGTMAGFTIEWPALGVPDFELTGLCPNTYEFIVRDSRGCEFASSVVITSPDTLIFFIDTITTRDVSCRTNTGQIATIAEGGNGNYEFTWTNDVSDKSIGLELPPGSYTVTVTDEKGCTETLDYTLEPTVPITAVIPTPEEPNCFGELTCFTVSDAGGGVGGPYSFQVNSGPRIALDTCVQLFAGQYRIDVFDEAGCSLDTTIVITQPDPVTVELGDDIEVILGNDSEKIIATIDSDFGIDSIGWSLLDPFVCSNDDDCVDIVVQAIQNQTVTVFVRDVNGCSDTDELNILINDIRQVYLPNIFSPDGDGRNDFFQAAIGAGVEIINTMIIYDRWGNKMYQQDNYIPDPALNDGWDGMYDGNPVNPGVYVYYLQATFKDGRTLTYSGDVTIVR